MEDKRLNFNRPLLSVRRFSSTAASQKDSRRKNGSSIPAISPSPSYKSELQSGLRNPGSVPFVWEQTPGRPKYETKTQKHAKALVPKLPPGRISKPNQQDSLSSGSVFPTEEKLMKFKSSKVRSSIKNDEDLNGDMYMDALDTPDFIQSGTHVPPKAKVMASEVPQSVKKVNRTNEKPQITYGPNFLQFASDDNEEDSDFDYDEHESSSYKVCGLLPHFCLKGSIGLLNPVPGLSVRSRLPISSANRTRATASSTISEPARVAVYEHRLLDNHQKDQHVLNKESTEITNQKILGKLEGSGQRDHLQGRGISNDSIEPSPPSVFERKEVDLQKKGLISFKELLAAENEKEGDTHNPTIEKTVYVDTIAKVDSHKNEQSDFKENDVDIFEISHIPTEPMLLDLLVDDWKQDKDTKTATALHKDPKVNQDPKVSRLSGSELPAPPPLPKSPSDSWLWRTLPSRSSKTASLRLSSKYPAKLDKDVQLRNPKGLLLPIPET